MSDQYDWIDGKKVPRLIINDDYILTGTHRGGVHVESGKFILEGILQGSLDIQPGVSSKIIGTQQGSVTIGRDAIVSVTGAIQGSTTVQDGATLIIEDGGKLAGPLSNYGKVIIRGVFGGPQTGDGEIVIEGNGYIKQPIIRNGTNFYDI